MNNKRNMTLLALTLASFGSMAYAQDSFTVPNGTAFSDTFIGPGDVIDATNAFITQTASTSYLLGSSAAVSGFTLTEIATATFASEAVIVMTNDAYPGEIAAFNLSDTTSYTGTFTAAAATRTVSGSLVSANIAAGSTWTIYFTDSVTDTTDLPEQTVAGLSFTTGVFDSPLPSPDAITITGTFNTIDAAGTGATPATINQTSVGGSLSSPLVVSNRVRFYSGTYTTIDPTTFPNEARIRVRHTAAPGLNLDLVPADYFGAFAAGTTLTVRSRVATVGGTLIGQVLPTSGNFTYEFFESVQDGLPATPEASLTDVSFGFIPATFAPATQTFTFAGPVPSVDAAGDPDNAILTGTVASSFAAGSTVLFGGSYSQVQSGEIASHSRIRIRNSAIPIAFMEFTPFSNSLATVTTESVLANRVATGILIGVSMPTGSTVTFEVYNATQNGTANIAESNLTNLSIGLNATAPLPPATPPSATDLGTIGDTSSTYGVADVTANLDIVGQAITWYKFTVPANVSDAAGTWLDIDTLPQVAGTAGDSEIGIYTTLGLLVASDDDDGPGTYSALSFGQVSPVRGPLTSGTLLTGVAGNGRDLNLPSGTYYLAVANYNVAFAASGFGVTNSTPIATVTTPVTVNFRTNVPPPIQVISGTLALGAVSGTPTFTRAMSAQLLDGSGNPVGSAVTINASTPTAFSVSIPSSLTGSYSLLIDGSTFLKRRVALTLTGSNQSLGTVVATNGDVNADGIVDGNDVNAILADFGNEGDGLAADVNMDSIVDGNDINVVLGTFGSEDE